MNPRLRIIIALAIILFILTFLHQKKSRGIFFHDHLHTSSKHSWTWWLLVVASVLCLVSLFNPSRGTKLITVTNNGVDVMIMLDVSKSMKVQDIRQGGTLFSRLESAKSLIQKLVTEQPQNRYGLGIFAGEAQGVSPLTTDHDVYLTFVSGVDDTNLTEQGTNLSAALDIGIDRFKADKRSKVLLIMSDGGDEKLKMEGSSSSEKIKKQDIHLITIGLGTTKGGPIPVGNDPFGTPMYKQFQGQTVTSVFNPTALQDLANKLNGSFFHISSVNSLNKVYHNINKLEKKALDHRTGEEKQSLIRPLTSVILTFFTIYIIMTIFSPFMLFKIVRYPSS